jgi:mono/diheme cytochrome c family protein
LIAALPDATRVRSGALAAFLAVASLCATAQGTDPRNPYDAEPRWAEMGRGLYLRMGCIGCHGPDARGATAPDLTDPHWRARRTETLLFEVIKYGRPDSMMAGYGDELEDEQIWLLVSYLRSEERRRRSGG